MLTDSKLRAQVDQLWDKLWSGGLTNPLDAIEQLSFLIFLKRLTDEEDARQQNAQLTGKEFTPSIPTAMRWDNWSKADAATALRRLRDEVFPWLRNLDDTGSSFTRHMANAECKINKPSLLIQACSLIDQLHISNQNQDVQGDLYEYLLSKLNTAGRNGQFRTPRHIIRMMVRMVDPQPYDRIGDLAAGTAGFLVNAYQHILEQNTSPDILTYDEEGMPHHLVGDLLTEEQMAYLQGDAFHGYDNDSGMAMLRIGAMNLMLHGIRSPKYDYADTLGQGFTESNAYTLLLMNPPFKGAVDKDDVSETLPSTTTKSELLFLHLILRALDNGGRCAVIVPDGVLFGSSNAHKEIRKKIIESNRLDGVVSMPGGVFKPYAGVSTAVLLFTKADQTDDKIWFYDMAHDGFGLDDKRQPIAENDIPDILECWKNRHDPEFQKRRSERLAELKQQIGPLQEQRLALEVEIHRLKFESVIALDEDLRPATALATSQAKLAEIARAIDPLGSEIDRLSRQFHVSRLYVASKGYDLSASRYRDLQSEVSYLEDPKITIERLKVLEQVIAQATLELEHLL